MTDRKSLRTQIAGAVAAVRGGEEDHAILRLSRLTAAAQPVIRASGRELATANVEMLRAAAPCGARGVDRGVRTIATSLDPDHARVRQRPARRRRDPA